MTNSSRPSQSILKAAGEGGRRQLTQAEAVVVLQQRLIPLVAPRLVRRNSMGAGRVKKAVDQHE